MKYQPTDVEGAFVVSLEPRGDDRGFFARMFCSDEFASHGLDGAVSQVNTSLSAEAGTLRGMHYQVAPHGEAKLVKCIGGAAFDVVLDLRAASPTFGRWAASTLTPDNRLMMYVPKGCAHGFLTLEAGTEMLYTASAAYAGAAERIVRWNDPAFAIGWPREPAVLSPKDHDAGDYDPAWHNPGY
jgi:dTDP-4-dehydrorhamnose 3,5-epimerase